MNPLEQLDRIALDKEIQSHLGKAAELATGEVEKMARKILKTTPKLKEFVMAMGSWCFMDKRGNTIDPSDINEFPSLEPLHDFLCKWDNVLNITGESMRFTANGPKITEW